MIVVKNSTLPNKGLRFKFIKLLSKSHQKICITLTFTLKADLFRMKFCNSLLVLLATFLVPGKSQGEAILL